MKAKSATSVGVSVRWKCTKERSASFSSGHCQTPVLRLLSGLDANAWTGLLVNRTQCSCCILLAQLPHKMLFVSIAALQQLLLTLPLGHDKDGKDENAPPPE